MRNLSLWDVIVNDIQIDSEDNLCLCYGNDTVFGSCDLYVFTHNLVITSFGKFGNTKWRKDILDIVSPRNSPINITFLSITNTLCVGLSNGELLTIGDSGNIYELAGVCENQLLAMEWSPDQELLVLVTKAMKCILMSCTFDPIQEVYILRDEFGEKEFNTVGWGKKETQFHGSEGKAAARVAEVVPDVNTIDETVKITWRGDGNLFAVGYANDGLRRFKVFNREGILQYTSEKQEGLEANLSWRPSGNVIATTQRLQSDYIVSFFEKNGLKHGSFSIPVNSDTRVENITWSSDSEVLTLKCRDAVTDTQQILLFTSSNCHWYLKQSLVFKDNLKLHQLAWDSNFDVINNKKLHVVLSDGREYIYTWIWNIDRSKGMSDSDNAVITVIDGNKILATGFRQTVIPPPMSAIDIELGSSVNSIHFAPQNSETNTNSFFVCTTNNKIIFYDLVQSHPLQYKLSKTLDLDPYIFPFQYYNWFWMNPDTLLSISVSNDGHNLVKYTIDGDILKTDFTVSLPAAATSIESDPTDNSIAYIQLNDGEIIKFRLDEDNKFIEPLDISFTCLKFNVVTVENELYFIGLTHKGNLYINNEIIMNNVSSFYIDKHFLLLTTLQHLLLCVELTKLGLKALQHNKKDESSLLYKRKIERGAKLVIVVPNDTRTIFQLPRGNLETIQPRPLSLKIIGEFLDKLKFYDAFNLMRKQRINLNLLYDHSPQNFISNINTFIDSIDNNSWLSLFLSDLENMDVTKSMYSSSYMDKSVNKESGEKIRTTCELIRKNLMDRSDKDKKILPLLTACVKKNTADDLEEALTIIKDLRAQEVNGCKLPVGSDEALKYLLYMVDVNQLFDVALGMYDFDLVLLVANKSQKDPKEYIPMLNEFSEMEENYKMFSINKHLKRFDRAVDYLAKCGAEKQTELIAFVKYHSLYKHALKLFSPEDDIYKQMSNDFGLYLRLKKCFTEAGTVYERAKNLEKAIECYEDALEWELAVNLAHNTQSKTDFNELCRNLIKGLKEVKRHKDALTILEQFCENKEDAIIYAIDNGQYKTALRLSSQFNRNDLKETHLLPTLVEDSTNLQELIENNWNMFLKYRERLRIVRENKIKNPIEIYDPEFENRDSDLYSDAGSTMASSRGSSSKSFRSSKNRRKHERKVASLKEGSQYEDVALVIALYNLVTSSYDLRMQVKEVNIALCCFDKDKEAFILQTSLTKLLNEMGDSFKEIWNNELVLAATNAVIAAQNVPEGISVIPQGIASLDPHMRIAPVVQDITWRLDGL